MNGSRVESVMDPYVGLWDRLSLEERGELDTTTQVRWLQSNALYCDVRIPGGRPSFAGITRLEECSDEQLRWLMTQQGFAGTLLVEQGTCHWLRSIDYQPDRRVPDRARMRFETHYVIEQGVHLPYREVWRKLAPATGEIAALERVPTGDDLRHGFFVAVGDWFMYARERSWRPPQAESLLALVDAAADPRAELLRAADFEISFGYRRGGLRPWEISLSTLPFREGVALDLPERLSSPFREGGAYYCTDTGNGGRARWRVLEWSGDFSWSD